MFRRTPKVRCPRGKEGAAVIFVTLAMVLIVTCAGLVVDVGFWYYNWSMMQAAADQAALAGAIYLPSQSLGASAVTTLTLANGIPASEVITSHPFPVGAVDPHQYEVVLRRASRAFFSSLVGVGEAMISVRSVAQCDRTTMRGSANGYPPDNPFSNAFYAGRTYRSGSYAPFRWPGAGNTVNGKIQVNGTLDLEGQNNNFNGPVTVVGPISGRPDRSIFTGGVSCPGASIPPMPVDVSGQLADAKSARQYFKREAGVWYQWGPGSPSWTTPPVAPDGSAFTESSLEWSTPNAVVSGVYYVEGAGITIGGSNLNGTATFIADGEITIQANNIVTEATAVFGFISLSTQDDAITIFGNNAVVNGAYWAPNGGFKMSGNNMTLNGGLFADSFEEGQGGNNNVFNYSFGSIMQVMQPPPVIKTIIHLVD